MLELLFPPTTTRVHPAGCKAEAAGRRARASPPGALPRCMALQLSLPCKRELESPDLALAAPLTPQRAQRGGGRRERASQARTAGRTRRGGGGRRGKRRKTKGADLEGGRARSGGLGGAGAGGKRPWGGGGRRRGPGEEGGRAGEAGEGGSAKAPTPTGSGVVGFLPSLPPPPFPKRGRFGRRRLAGPRNGGRQGGNSVCFFPEGGGVETPRVTLTGPAVAGASEGGRRAKARARPPPRPPVLVRARPGSVSGAAL